VTKRNSLILLSEFINNQDKFIYHTDNVFRTLSTLDNDYPNFTNWYYTKVIPELKLGEREVIMAYNDADKVLSGISILKITEIEKKICTLRISPKYRKNGLGKVLFTKSLEILETDKPVITITKDKVHQFSPLLGHFGFKLSQVIKDYYINSREEYVYNGFLTQNFQLNNNKIETVVTI